ncbi:MAG: hypothetical protein EBU88_08655 [Acidobacteria bacterium]|nr:hypothetical protein [Acidobacteriota bacterium]
MTTQTKWLPEIVYENDAKIPTIVVPEGQEMPKVLFIFEGKMFKELSGNDDEEVEVVDLDLHSYFDMHALKAGLTAAEYDKVRDVLGLLPLKDAASKGKQITQNVRTAVEGKN